MSAVLRDAWIYDAVRTPIGRYGGALAGVRTDDLAAVPIRALIGRYPDCSWDAIDDVIYGCANQAGEDNRNVARMAALLAGLPIGVGGVTVNRLCGSGLDAVAMAARAIRTGEAHSIIAGGVESMSRAPYVIGKADSPFERGQHMYDTTIGWRFVNPEFERQFGTDSMPETAENLAREHGITRADQDAVAQRSQERVAQAIRDNAFADEITAVSVPQSRGPSLMVERDEHPRLTSLEALGKLRPIVSASGTVTAGNASGVNDGACALLLADRDFGVRHGLAPMARVVASAVSGVEPRVMGMGPVPAIQKLLTATGLRLEQIDLIELNEAFAAQALAVTRTLGLNDDDPRVNPQGGAIALGHPLGMSGARLVTTAVWQLRRRGTRFALCSMCIGVGQGIAILLERHASE